MAGEFRGDFTRDTFDPKKDFLRVLMQQGRVQVDADWNEQVAILLDYLQTLAEDLIGPHGGPVERSGFKISWHNEEDVNNNTLSDLRISKGHYYVNGILCQNNQTDKNDKDSKELSYIKYYEQPYYFLNQNQNKLPDLPFLVFLDVWERHITYIQDDRIREVALGGADTATRSQVVWQVKVKKLDTTYRYITSCANINWENLLEEWQPKNRGLLAAKAKEATEQTEACIIKSDARYRGTENQLYRVEIHLAGTADKATFKWSRENASVAFPIDTDMDIPISDITITVQLKHWWRDCRFGLAEGDWVEIVNDYISLHQVANPLWKVDKIEPEDFLVTLTREESSRDTDPKTIDKDYHPLLRRWDHKERSGLSLEDGAVPISAAEAEENEDNWFTLEDGVQIKFKKLTEEEEHSYRTGDYWLIPARIATGDVEWDDANGTPLAIPPHGVEHHYAPLAVITNTNNPEDCRHQFSPLGRSYSYLGSERAIGADLI